MIQNFSSMNQLCDDLKVGFKTKQSALILVDLVLSKMVVDKNYLQLLGITAIFIFIKVLYKYPKLILSARKASNSPYPAQPFTVQTHTLKNT